MAIYRKLTSLSELPFRAANRLIVVDPGTFSIKLLLAEKHRGQIKVIRHEAINLQEERLLTNDEISEAVRSILASLGDYPVALVLPAHLAFSQILDLGSAANGVRQLVEAETLKNRDLRDSQIVYDCTRLQPFGKHPNSFWVTLCKEADIFTQVTRLGLDEERVCDVVPSSNALAAAYNHSPNPAPNTVLVDIGATNTLLAILLNGQVVHSTSFPVAGNLFTENIASSRQLSIDAAESLKQTKNLLNGTDAVRSLIGAVDGWRNEVERVVRDWIRDNPETNLSISSVTVSGGGSVQPGLIEYLNEAGTLKFSAWPTSTTHTAPAKFVMAYGSAVQVLTNTSAGGSLLPASFRAAWSRQRIQQRFLAATTFLILLAFLALGFGTWQKWSLISQKQEVLAQATIALKKAELMDSVEDDLLQRYERIRPVLRRQQQTLDALNTLAAVERSRTNRSLWYVLIADQQSYVAGKTTGSTNFSSMQPISKNGFVAELCLKEEGEAMRTTLGQVVTDLKQSQLFRSVDTLPADLRKDLANPKVLIPNRHFALALELADHQFENPVRTDSTNVARAGDSPTISPPKF